MAARWLLLHYWCVLPLLLLLHRTQCCQDSSKIYQCWHLVSFTWIRDVWFGSRQWSRVHVWTLYVDIFGYSPKELHRMFHFPFARPPTPCKLKWTWYNGILYALHGVARFLFKRSESNKFYKRKRVFACAQDSIVNNYSMSDWNISK